MRHKYDTRGIVLARAPVGEASASVTLLTEELGLVRARAQSVRMRGAKLASALATFAESSLTLVRGKESWRVAGAVLEENWFARIEGVEARRAAARVIGLLVRLVAGESPEAGLYAIVRSFMSALATVPADAVESAEALAALRILAAIGLDAGEIPGEPDDFSPVVLAQVRDNRVDLVARINRGIEASGL